MSFHLFPSEPPTAASLADARRLLDESNASLGDVNHKIETAEAQLAQIVAESHCAIKQLQLQREALEDKIARARAYMSPIRRLPNELLRHIFIMNFDEYPCCAWILSSVCSQWRRLALSMPRLWSKVCYSSFPVYLFLRGSCVGQAWASLEFSVRFPTEPICSIRVIACLDRRALSPNPTIISPCLNIHMPTERSSAPSFCAPTCQKLANGVINCESRTVTWLRLGMPWTLSFYLFRYIFCPDAVRARP